MTELTDGLIATTLCPTPCDATPKESNALERPLTAFQHRVIIADIMMDWMESQQLSYSRASDICGVSTHIVVSVCNRATINLKIFHKLVRKIPGLSEHTKGAI